MRRKIFMACVALVVSAAAVVGVKAYNYHSMPALMRANLEALSESENKECNFKNGYTAFTGKEGGGYDCCRIWRDLRPDTKAKMCGEQ